MKALPDDIKIVPGPPTARAYQELREAVGWHTVDLERSSEALEHSLHCIHARRNGEVIGCGRVVGDGAMYFYLQDILVDPAYQNLGVGTAIVETLMEFVLDQAPKHSGCFIGLMTAPGLEQFYAKFGFETYPDDCPGMRIWRNGH